MLGVSRSYEAAAASGGECAGRDGSEGGCNVLPEMRGGPSRHRVRNQCGRADQRARRAASTPRVVALSKNISRSRACRSRNLPCMEAGDSSGVLTGPATTAGAEGNWSATLEDSAGVSAVPAGMSTRLSDTSKETSGWATDGITMVDVSVSWLGDTSTFGAVAEAWSPSHKERKERALQLG